MSGGSFFRMMVGLVLCLMLGLPALLMPMAMAGAPVMMDHGRNVGGHDRPVATIPGMMAGMEGMMMSPSPMVRHAGMAGAPSSCCQNHHGICDAGLLPAGRPDGPVQAQRATGCWRVIGLSPQSFVGAPWRPPALLPV